MKPVELDILIGLHRNVNAIDKKTIALAKEHGLTFSQFMVLEALYSKGPMTVGQVRDKILSSVGTMPVIVNNLVKQNYVKRLTSNTDKRLCILELTEEGYEVIHKVAPRNVELIKDSMTCLVEEEKEILLYLLKKLGGRLHGAASKE